MEPMWYFLQLLKPILGMAFGYCFPKCFIPLKKGMEIGDQRLVNKGSVYLMISIASLFILIMIFARVE